MNDVIVVFYDSWRYLPENVYLSQISIKVINWNGSIVQKESISKCYIEMSTCQKPYYGIRNEISKKNHSSLDCTAMIVIRIDAIEKVKASQVVVGYAFFPLFIDLDTDLPARK